MKISIVTICFNSEDTIEKTIQSVIGQTYKEIEYIIIDGGSTDATKSIIEKYRSKIAYYVSEKDHGIYDAMNKGVQACTGDVIGILNSDDFYADENVLEDIMDVFLKNPELESIYADLVYVDRLMEERILRYWKSGAYKKGQFLKGWMPPHPTFFVRKNVYTRFGGYNLELKSSSDYEFMLRVLHKHEISTKYLPRVITKMRAGGQSNISLKNRIRANKEDRKAWKMNGLKPRPFTLLLKPLSKLKQWRKRS